MSCDVTLRDAKGAVVAEFFEIETHLLPSSSEGH
jgi:hypothetical protein